MSKKKNAHMSVREMLHNQQKSALKTQPKDLNFVDDCTTAVLLEHNTVPSFTIYVVLTFLCLFIVWANWAKIDRVTVAEGKIIPSSEVQIIEELYDGVVKSIPVKKGQVVHKDQVLVELDPTYSTADYRQANAKLQALQATIARLQAQANGADHITFPAHIQAEREDLMKREIDLFAQRREALASNLAVLRKSLRLAEDELSIISPLVRQGVTSQVDLLRVRREVNEMKGEIEKAQDDFRDQSLSKLNQLQAESETLIESMASLKAKLQRTTVRSPVNGVIKKINVNRVGAVIKSGMDIMEIVPLEDSLLVEAHVKPSDIGFLHPEQVATVKLTAYDYTIYGGLQGKVEYISADTITDERKEKSYYIVTVRTEKNHLGTDRKPLSIIPGMTATVHILAGKRSILNYLLKPILRAKYFALTEH